MTPQEALDILGGSFNIYGGDNRAGMLSKQRTEALAVLRECVEERGKGARLLTFVSGLDPHGLDELITSDEMAHAFSNPSLEKILRPLLRETLAYRSQSWLCEEEADA